MENSANQEASIGRPNRAAVRACRVWVKSVASVAVVLVAAACTGSTPAPHKATAVSMAPGRSTAGSPAASTPAERGAKVASGVAAAFSTSDVYANIRGVVVVADGRTVFEHYYDSSAAATWDTASVTKSVMSTLIGIALHQGRLRSVNQTLAQMLPSYAPTMKPSVAATTLRQVLTMTAGFAGDINDPGDDFVAAQDWVRGVLDSPVRPPGQGFGYSNGGAHLLSAILVTATGMSVLDYARANLFDPLGIDSRPAAEPLADPRNLDIYTRAAFAWPVDPQGRHLGFAGLKLRPSDMAELGQLYLDQGRWNGKQVVPAAWVRAATQTQVAAQWARAGYDYLTGYGYLWWTTTADGNPAYLAAGSGGQLIEVVPARHLVVAVASELDPNDAARISAALLTGLVDLFIAPAVRS